MTTIDQLDELSLVEARKVLGDSFLNSFTEVELRRLDMSSDGPKFSDISNLPVSVIRSLYASPLTLGPNYLEVERFYKKIEELYAIDSMSTKHPQKSVLAELFQNCFIPFNHSAFPQTDENAWLNRSIRNAFEDWYSTLPSPSRRHIRFMAYCDMPEFEAKEVLMSVAVLYAVRRKKESFRWFDREEWKINLKNCLQQFSQNAFGEDWAAAW